MIYSMAENDGWDLIIRSYSITQGFVEFPDQVCAFLDELNFTQDLYKGWNFLDKILDFGFPNMIKYMQFGEHLRILYRRAGPWILTMPLRDFIN